MSKFAALNAYLEWANRQVCQGCGAKASDRTRDENGAVKSGPWATEDQCWDCFASGKPYVDRRPNILGEFPRL